MAEMSIAEIKQSAEDKMGKTLESLKVDLAKVRTGRAHVGILTFDRHPSVHKYECRS